MLHVNFQSGKLKFQHRLLIQNYKFTFFFSSFELNIRNLNNINYNLVVSNLLNNIDVTQSYFKVRFDFKIIF
jgi:hypothetical protein